MSIHGIQTPRCAQMPDEKKPVEGVEVTSPILVKVKLGNADGEKREKGWGEGKR